ncbi:MAG TPA: histidine kinase [Gammaproteobacteria bacterium]|nr:histidine kinase [Gammaproteobacteria bacterium]
MITIVVLAVVGMATSVVMAELMKGEAAAINVAGSLRMQAYRVATALLEDRGRPGEREDIARAVRGFEDRLFSPQLTDVVPRSRGHAVRVAYRQVTSEWRADIKPLLAPYTGGSTQAPALARARARYIQAAGPFVSDIDHLVKTLENDAESKINLLRLLQGFALLLTIVVAYFTMSMMYGDVLVPLRDLLSCARAARRQDFSVRARHAGGDELGQLGQAFNVMAADLSRRYEDLESRVQEKTAELERRNRSLELLYRTTARLSETPLSDASLTLLLREIHRQLGIGGGAICLTEGAGHNVFTLATTLKTARSRPVICKPGDCRHCAELQGTRIRDRVTDAGAVVRTLSVPLSDQEQRYGVLTLEVDTRTPLDDWQVRLIETIGRHVAIAIATTRRRTQNRRLLLLEERAVIARELHDSLAQSLSYLKIQVARLQSQLDPEQQPAVREIVQELREGLTRAYRELRELLTTFRLKMDGRGLEPALAQTVDEFRCRSGIAIDLSHALGHGALSVNQEIHVLQIIREALSNVQHHARARRAWVVMEYAEDGSVIVAVDDDGIGMPAAAERAHHYGLAIMHERAHSLGGELRIVPRDAGGTRIEVRFRPAGQSGSSGVREEKRL